MPINDNDMFDWQTKSLDEWSIVRDIISKKIKLKELVGISMTWKNTNIGGEFHFDSKDNSLGVSLSCNRRTIDNTNDTDFEWYIEKLIRPLEGSGFKVLSYEFSQD